MAQQVDVVLPLVTERAVYPNGTRERHVHLGWARSCDSPAARLGLRRGAWYRVVEDRGRPWVVLDVNAVEIRSPRVYLQFRWEPPTAWSVVRSAPQASQPGPPRLVCPVCHGRHELPEGLTELECPDCCLVYPVEREDPV